MINIFTKKLWKKRDLNTKGIELKSILNDSNSKEIIEIMDLCIENIYRSIDTHDIEEDFPDKDINKYIENYKRILILIKDIFIKKNKDISAKDKEIFLSRLEDARNKFKIEIDDILSFFNIIFLKICEYKDIKIAHDDIIFFCIDPENNISDWTNFLKENIVNEN
jgi:hypothetical protein